MNEKPLSEERLAEIRALLYEDLGVDDLDERLASDWAAVRYSAAVNSAGRSLLAEVERLRAEKAIVTLARAIVAAHARPSSLHP